MSDLINRQDAIYMVLKWFDRIKLNEDRCLEGLRSLSSIEPEKYEDCISRQAVLDIDFNRICLTTAKPAEMIRKIIGKLPSVKQEPKPGWIPVSERLPEVGSEVLVCFDFKENRSVYISNFYGDGKFHGLDDEYLTSEGRKYRKAVAWQPLPDPYDGEV